MEKGAQVFSTIWPFHAVFHGLQTVHFARATDWNFVSVLEVCNYPRIFLCFNIIFFFLHSLFFAFCSCLERFVRGSVDATLHIFSSFIVSHRGNYNVYIRTSYGETRCKLTKFIGTPSLHPKRNNGIYLARAQTL